MHISLVDWKKKGNLTFVTFEVKKTVIKGKAVFVLKT